MPMPMRYAHASSEFDAFLDDARDELGLQTSHQTYTAVQAVLWTFRRRLPPKDVIALAQLLPPVLSAIYLQDWDPDAPTVPFADAATHAREVATVRADHNFAPPTAIRDVGRALRRHVDVAELDRLLARVPAGAAAFWGG